MSGARHRHGSATGRHDPGVPVRTLKQAAAFVDRVGVALLFPKDDLVLPSLWEAAGGEDEYAERDADGNFVRWTPVLQFIWPTKDALPAEKLCAAGKHVRGRASLVALDLLPAFVALANREPEGLEREVAELVRAHGALSTRVLPDLLPAHERKQVRAAIDRLQKQFVLTNAGLEETDGWPAITVDLVDRRYRDHLRRKLPSPDEARRTIAQRVLDAVGELSAEDLRGALGWRKADCVAALEATEAPTSDEDGITLWRAPRREQSERLR
jgi:hypothetical protein